MHLKSRSLPIPDGSSGLVSRVGFPGGLHGRLWQKERNWKSHQCFQTENEQGVAIECDGEGCKKIKRGVCVCVCTHACRGSGFQSWIPELEIWVRHKNGDAELVDGPTSNRSDISNRDL